MHQTKFKIGTIVLTFTLAGMLGWHASQNASSTSALMVRSNQTTDAGNVTGGVLSESAFGATEVVEAETETPEVIDPASALRVGVIGATPQRQEVTLLKTLPTSEPLMKREYVNARDRACRMLVPGATVEPARTVVRTGREGTLGRVTVMTIGLELDSRGRQKMPSVTRGQILQYFRDHRLAIQPVVYHDADGRPYFGTDCQAAFFELAHPTITVSSEPMIATAVSRFRALGVVANGDNEQNARSQILGRTLALAFIFEKSDSLVGASGDAKRLATEMMFVHIPENATAGKLDLEVYITSDEGRTLNRLDTGNRQLNSPTPTITADVRFDKMVLLGLYPSSPVVTSIHYRTAGVLSMATVEELSRPKNGKPGMGMTEILDQFGKLSQDIPALSGI